MTSPCSARAFSNSAWAGRLYDLPMAARCSESGKYATMSFDSGLVDTVRIDEAKKQADVGEIVEGEFFQSLKHRVDELRKR